jgi:hypothetical protein
VGATVSAILPIQRGSNRFQFEIDLDSRTVVFRFEWNDRLDSWFFDLLNIDQTPILSGVSVVVGIPLWNRFRDPRIPPGSIEAIDTSGAGIDPAFEDLGDRVVILYTRSLRSLRH